MMTRQTNELIYLDSNSTTPIDERVFEAMKPYFFEKFGNSSSKTHSFGWDADIAVESARKQIAQLINCTSREIFFTSGGTESNNLVLQGVIEQYKKENPDKTPHIVSTEIEHKATLDTLKALEQKKIDVTYLKTDSYGRISLDELISSIKPNTVLVSIMAANNEIGTLQDISDIGEVCRNKNIYFHSDAVQALAYQKIDVQKMNIDLLTLTAHKMYGPKGIGAVFVRHTPHRVKLQPILFGGGQEKSLRPGTLNTPAIVGFGKACELASQEMHIYSEKVQGLRDELLIELLKIPFIKLNGHPIHRSCNNINICVDGIQSTQFMREIKALAVSTGSACSSENASPSHVLKAIGLTDEECSYSIRIGLSKFTTEEEIKIAAEIIKSAANRLRNRNI